MSFVLLWFLNTSFLQGFGSARQPFFPFFIRFSLAMFSSIFFISENKKGIKRNRVYNSNQSNNLASNDKENIKHKNRWREKKGAIFFKNSTWPMTAFVFNIWKKKSFFTFPFLEKWKTNGLPYNASRINF